MIIVMIMKSRSILSEFRMFVFITCIYVMFSSVFIYILFRSDIVPDSAPKALNLTYASRYFYLSTSMFIIIVFLACNTFFKYRKHAFFLATIYLLIVSSYNFTTSISYNDYNWHKWALEIEKGNNQTLTIPINPPGWYIEINKATNNR